MITSFHSPSPPGFCGRGRWCCRWRGLWRSNGGARGKLISIRWSVPEIWELDTIASPMLVLLITKQRLFSLVRPASCHHQRRWPWVSAFRRRIRILVGGVSPPDVDGGRGHPDPLETCYQYGDTAKYCWSHSYYQDNGLGWFPCLPAPYKSAWHSVGQENLRYVNPITHPYSCGPPCQEMYQQ